MCLCQLLFTVVKNLIQALAFTLSIHTVRMKSTQVGSVESVIRLNKNVDKLKANVICQHTLRKYKWIQLAFKAIKTQELLKNAIGNCSIMATI